MSDTLDMDFQTAPTAPVSSEKVFNTAILISAVRCTLTYVVLPFVAPVLALAPGVAPAIGAAVGVVAIGANLFSIRRLRRSGHRLRKPLVAINGAMIGLLVVLLWFDLRELLVG